MCYGRYLCLWQRSLNGSQHEATATLLRRYQLVLLTLVVLATAEFPEGIKAAIPKGLQVKTVSQGVPFAHAVQG